MVEDEFKVPDVDTINSYANLLDKIASDVVSQGEVFNTDYNAIAYDVINFMNEIKSVLDNLKSQIDEIQNHINTLNAQLEQLKIVIKELIDEGNQIDNEIKESKSEINHCESEIRALQDSDDENAQQRIAALESRIDSLKTKIISDTNKLQQLNAQYEDCVNTYNSVNQELAEMTNKKQLYIAKFNQIQEEGNNFYSRWEIVQQNVSNCNIDGTVSEANQSINSLSNNLKQLADQVASIEWGYSGV